MNESIGAVESMVMKLAGKNSLSLALNALDEKKVPIHEAMREALLKLYGYTSNADGIRHGMIWEATVGFDEAKYMVVLCSAFVNFVAAKAQAAGIRIER